MRRSTLGLAVLLAALLLVPAAAMAKHRTYKAYAGDPGPTPKSAPSGTALNRFFPRRITVRKGDSVRYLNYGFHTVSYLARGTARPGLLVPQIGATYSGINDPQGNPFYFDGQQKFIYNPAVFLPQGSHRVSGHGTTHSSGVFPGNPGKYKLKFRKPGKYRIVCLLHPGMVQTVTVVKHRNKADAKSKVSRKVARQVTTAYTNAKDAAATPAAPGTVYAGVEKKNSTLLAFLPNSITIHKNQTLTWVNHSPSETHNMVFVPTPAAKTYDTNVFSKTDQIPFPPGAPNQVDPALVYGTTPQFAHQPVSYDGRTYGGNGFLEAPAIDDDASTPVPTGQVAIKFTHAGTYAYYCRIHGLSMSGVVYVTGS